MATGTLAPAPVFTGLDSNGTPLNGGKVTTYAAGTTTEIATYTDQALTVAHANPIILDSAGRATIYLTPGTSYKWKVDTSADVNVYTVDNIQSVPVSSANLDITGTAGEALSEDDVVYLSDGSGSKTAGRWYKTDADNDYASSLAWVIGVAIADIALAAAGSIRIGGIVTGLTGLTAGTDYYVSATAAALTSSAPTNRRLVGRADSTTTLVVSADDRVVQVQHMNSGTSASATTFWRGDGTWVVINPRSADHVLSHATFN